MSAQEPLDPERLARERDLLGRLLDLGQATDLDALLREALALIVGVAGAEQGYLELVVGDDPRAESRWSAAHGIRGEDLGRVRAAISRGIIAEAMASGQTISTPSAFLDPRFQARDSVRLGKIESVLCVPIARSVPLGTLYLQGRKVFSEDDRKNAERFVRHVAPIAHRLMVEEANRAPDPTERFRGALRAEALVGSSPSLARLLEQMALVAPLDVSVLLSGESGTGKSLVARVIHDSSPREEGPFLELNCAALPESLIESELFGAAQGAHSTAIRKVAGKIEAAEHGTLFLDEIGELPLAVQGKLLQFLQSHQYYPLGATKPATADVRVITATNRDLREAVAERRFREDLFYRLEVMPIRVPALRERAEDVAALAARFLAESAKRHRLAALDVSPAAAAALRTAEWRGNVRQLQHAVEAGLIRAAGEGATTIEVKHVFPDATASVAAPGVDTFQAETRRFQRELLARVLAETDWNVTETARRLDLARSHLYTLVKALGLVRGAG